MDAYSVIGKPTPQLGSWEKVTGRAVFTDDIRLKDPLVVRILRSPFAAARIISIDTSVAGRMEGVKAIITGTAFRHTFGVLPISRDEPALATDRVRYVGEPVVAVAAENSRLAAAALQQITVNYECDEPCLKPGDAARTTANPIHPELGRDDNVHKSVHQEFGDMAAGFAAAEVTVSKRFKWASVTHAFTEPHATQVEIDAHGNITVYSATQVPHYLHLALAGMLEMPMQRIRVIKPFLGGGFGGKSDPFPHEMIAARLALETGRNIRLVLDREEVFFSHHGRHPTELWMKLGYHPQKGITALAANIKIDGGAYASFGVVTTYYNGILLHGPYRIANFQFECDRLYTNKPMCGAMRGHGGVNPRFAAEVLLDMACEAAGQDPGAARLGMIHEENSLTANEFRITSVGLRAALHAVMARTQWQSKFRQLPYGRGIGMACGFFISGSALPIHRTGPPASTVRMTIAMDGGVTVYSGAADIGQGSDTVLAQMAAEVLGLEMEQIRVVSADTRLCPVDLGSYSSRVTFMAGNAARNAAIRLRRVLVAAACELLEVPAPVYPAPGPPSDFFRQGRRSPDFEAPFLGANPNYNDGFVFRDGLISTPGGDRQIRILAAIRHASSKNGMLQARGIYEAPKMGGRYKGAGAGLSPAYSYTAFITEVSVEADTGFVRVEKTSCAHDAGFVLNPLAVEGQIEGSIHMGLGQALMEEVVHDNGVVQNPTFADYKIPSAFEMPEIDIVPVCSDDSEGPFGAKEAGEGVLAPFIPSVANAIYDAVGVRLTELPMRPDRVLKAIQRATRP